MEQKRRTINTAGKRRSKGRLAFMIIGTIVGLALIFYLAYTISFKIFSPDVNEKDEITTNIQEDLTNMPRQELVEKYLDLQKKLEEKDEEIKMLEDRLKGYENPVSTTAPVNTSTPTSTAPAQAPTVPTNTNAPAVSPPVQAPPTASPVANTPPPATTAPSDGLIDPNALGALDTDDTEE